MYLGTGDSTIAGRLSIGTSTAPSATLSITGAGTGFGVTFATADSSNNTKFLIKDSGWVGIGTTSPGATLSVAGNTFLGGTLTATGTIAFPGLASGSTQCLQIDASGNLTGTGSDCGSGGGGGSGTVSSGTQGQFAFYNANGTTVTATSSLYISPTGYIGIGTTSPWGRLSLTGSGTGSGIVFATADFGNNPKFVIQDRGYVGIGSASPTYPLDVAGFINTDQYNGYKQAGNTILYASSSAYSTLVGIGAGSSLLSSAQSNTAVGYQALNVATSSGGNTAVGYKSLSANSTGYENTANGMYGLWVNTTGNYNSAFGWGSLYANTTGSSNTAVGSSALSNNISGSNNVAFGGNALLSNSIGGSNTAVGVGALRVNTTGNNNTVSGNNSLYFNVSATNTVAIGASVGFGVSGSYNNQGGTVIGTGAGYSFQTGSDYNTLLGYQAGYDITTGNNNLILGTEQTTGHSVTTGSNNILIGNGVYYGLGSTTNNQLNIGNLLFGTGLGNNASLATGNLGIGTSTPSSKLTVWGTDTASTSAFAVVNSASTTVLSAYDNGTVTYSGLLYQSSDQRLKTDIASLDASTSLSLVAQLNPVSYTRIDQPSQGTTLGFLAQEVQKLFPSLVTVTDATALTPGGTLTLNYTGLIAPMVKAIQALTAELDTLQQTVAGFAVSITSAIGNFGKVNTQELCTTRSDGTQVCLTNDQLAALLSQSAASNSSSSVTSSGTSQASNSGKWVCTSHMRPQG